MSQLIKSICKALVLDETFVNTLAITASKRYKSFSIPKKNGGIREIRAPSQDLKAIQRYLLDYILRDLPVHKCAYAYKSGSNIKKNALAHASNNFLLRLDFKDFFYNIRENDFDSYYQKYKEHFPADWTEEDLTIFRSLVFRHGGLCIGSVTSPHLSNAICIDMDSEIHSLCESKGITYSRYSDDMYFSTNVNDLLFSLAYEIISIIEKQSFPSALKINKNKTIHTSNKRRKIVTGLVLTNNQKISIGRSKKRVLRSKIHKWESLTNVEKIQLKGYLAYVTDIEPELINSFCKKYGASKIAKLMKFKPET